MLAEASQASLTQGRVGERWTEEPAEPGSAVLLLLLLRPLLLSSLTYR